MINLHIYVKKYWIILDQLKNNFRTRYLWPCDTSGGRSPSVNKLKFITNTVYNKIVPTE